MKILKPRYEILTNFSEGGLEELKSKIPVIFDDIEGKA